ncbi:MAG TPA: hypothetical protein VGK91_05690 [Candidatus Udaeobacter sp.]|jgi:hypothetical protein
MIAYGRSKTANILFAVEFDRRHKARVQDDPQGAATSVWAAFVAPAEEVGGRYCEDCQVSQVTEGLISPVSPGLRPYALDPEHAKALWARSAELVGERF